MTDLDRHVRQPGRDKLVKQVRASFNKKKACHILGKK